MITQAQKTEIIKEYATHEGAYGRQQWGILGNGRKPDPATPREGRRLSGCKLLLSGTSRRLRA